MPGTDPQLGAAAPSIQVEEMDPLIGAELGGFQVVRLIAAGGMGLVYEALHPAIGRRAAVKVLKPEVAADAEWTKRFLSEARALGAIKHRNLIEVLNFGKTLDGREFLMMEFLDGEPLDAYIRRMGSLAPMVALGIVDQILNGLAEAHKKGVVHRDLKPANVFLLREHNGELLVKVLDFGLARQDAISLLDPAVLHAKRDDGASLLAGTPEYIAPEQAQGKKVDHAADLYSLGVMLYEMLTGALPFEAESVTRLLQKHLSERPPRLSTVMSNAPEGLEELVESLLQKEPENRPSSADVARATVQRLLKKLSQDSTAVRMVRPAEPDTKHLPTARLPRAEAGTDKALARAFPENRKRNVVIAALALLLLLLGVGIAFTGGDAPRPSPGLSEPVEDGRSKPPPEPVAVAPTPAPVPAPPTPSDDELAPVKPIIAAKAPTPPPAAETKVLKVVKMAPQTSVQLEKADCEPNDAWRREMTLNVQEMGGIDRVAKDSGLYELWESEGRKVVQAASSATTVNDCITATALYRKLQRRLGVGL